MAKLSISNLGATGPFKNKLINGNFNVWQRGTSFSTTTDYTADRWWLSHNATTCSVAQTTSTATPVNGGNICRMTLTTKGGSFTDFAIIQPLETINSRPYAGKTMTLSVYLRRNSTFNAGNCRINIYSSEGTDETACSTNRTDDYLDIPYSSLDTTNFTRFTLTVNIADDKTQLGVLIRLRESAIPDGSYIDIWGVQLEEGSTATAFESRSIGQELALCQRYFYKLTTYKYINRGYGTEGYLNLIFPVTMRVTPTASYTLNADADHLGTSIDGVHGYVTDNWTGTVTLNAGATYDAEL